VSTAELQRLRAPLSERAPEQQSVGFSPLKGRVHLDHIDAVRPVKQLGVISTHTLLFFAPVLAASQGTLMLLHVSREAFFFVSACMLAYANPVLTRRTIGGFYRRRTLSIAMPYACWTLIYWATEISFPFRAGPELHNLLHLSLTGYYQLYYLLVIAEFYLVYPLLLWFLRAVGHRPWRVMGALFLLQLAVVSLMHWQVLPDVMRNYWANRELSSYLLYLVGGMVAARYLRDFEGWVFRHVRAIVLATAASAAVAEVWFALAWGHTVPGLGTASDPFQPIVIPFNVGAILSLYILGRHLVSSARSERLRRWVRVGSNNAYGIFLAQMVFIHGLVDAGWTRLLAPVPWPLVATLTAALVFALCWATSWVLSHTRLARALTGQARIPWGQRARPVSDEGVRRARRPPYADRQPAAVA